MMLTCPPKTIEASKKNSLKKTALIKEQTTVKFKIY